MSEEAIAKRKDFKPQEISNLLWALAKADVDLDPELVREMSDEAIVKRADFNPQAIANLVWALATAKADLNPELVKAVSAEAVANHASGRVRIESTGLDDRLQELGA